MQKKIQQNNMEEISIGIPKETLEVLEKVAKRKDLPLKALIKFYIGQGLRNDLSKAESKELAIKRLILRKKPNIDVKIDLVA